MKKMNLIFNAAVAIDETHLLAVSTNFNGLFMVDQCSGSSEYLGSFPNEPRFVETMFFEGCIVQNKVFWSPQTSWHIGVYDLESKELKSLEIPYIENGRFKFSDIVEHEGKAYLITNNARYLLEISPDTLEMNYYVANFNEKIFCRRACKIGHHLYVTSIWGDELVDWNLKKKESNLIRIGNEFRGSFSLCCVGNELWIAPRYYGDSIEIYNCCTGKIREIVTTLTGEEGRKNISTFLHCFFDGEFVHLISQAEINSIRINPVNKQVDEDKKFPTNSNEYKTGVFFVTEKAVFFGKFDLKESFYWTPRQLSEFSIESKQVREGISFYIDKNSMGYQELCSFLFGNVIPEQNGLGLEKLIGLIGVTE